ncbi:arylesterase [Polaribacter litorisediminis]|uniref:arylesterase n=1 Tax=Polaribacter litorisediminis TaxID=1908341 RepID=UPI001CC0AB4D|nr:arylesterase [Polaribacter litorisediminis]UAM99443.1 arylesterase [Polaribacter litorisediminis]
MLNLKNKQLQPNIKDSAFNVFIKLCYFSSVILLLSCGSDTSKKSENIDNVTQNTESKKTEKNVSKKILFFGDSLTAGYGLEDINDAFPALIQNKIDALSLDYTVINSGLSGETSAGGKSRINWVLNQKIDIFILELGANDGLRGIPLKETRKNLQAIIDAVLAKNADTKIVLAGMQLPPNMGNDYITEFKKIFPELAKKNGLELIPFLLKNVGGIPALNQSDGIHPTAEGQKILANNVWAVLEPMLTS